MGLLKMKIVIAIPAYNEELVLEKNINKISDFCVKNLVGNEFIIIIANNNSTDKTAEIANQLSAQNPAIRHLLLNQRGKGLAIAKAWQETVADIYCFMDADLATDLSALLTAVEQIRLGAEVVVGTRFHQASKVKRSWSRAFISRCYRLFFKALFKIPINYFPCGFKAINKKVRDSVLNDILNTGFFWDTEMLVLASRQGFSLTEIPVIWSEFIEPDRKSRLNIIKTAFDYIRQSILLKIR